MFSVKGKSFPRVNRPDKIVEIFVAFNKGG